MTLPLSEADFDRQFATASRRSRPDGEINPLPPLCTYNAVRGVIIELNNDCAVCVSLRLLPELVGASAKDLRRVEIMGIGQAIQWPTLDQQFDVLQLVADAVGTTALLEKLGQRRDSVKSKTAASRANGTTGGRPQSDGQRPSELRLSARSKPAKCGCADANSDSRQSTPMGNYQRWRHEVARPAPCRYPANLRPPE